MVSNAGPSILLRRAPSCGFLLAEVLVAGVVLGIGLAIIVGLSGRAIAMQTDGRHLRNAAQLADERLNLVLATGTENFRRRRAVP
jgi:Tfp pilus assembly protein PilV